MAPEHPVGVGDAAGRVSPTKGVSQAAELVLRLRVVNKGVGIFSQDATRTPHSTEAVTHSGPVSLLLEESFCPPERVKGFGRGSLDPQGSCNSPQHVCLTGHIPDPAVDPTGVGEKA